MKWALIALAIEISLARIFVNSWGWALLIVAVYCTCFFVWQIILIKKLNKDKARMEHEDTMISEYINSNRSQKRGYDIFPTMGVMQKN